MTKNLINRIARHLNLATIILTVMIIYILAYIFSYIGRDKLAVYEVEESNIVDSIEGTGVIIRSEYLYQTEQDGFVNYYVRDGARVQQGGTVYTLDTTGKIQTFLEELMAKQEEVSEDERNRVAEDLSDFTETYSDDNFLSVYEAHKNINHSLTFYTDSLLAVNKKELQKKYGKKSYIAVKTPKEGIVSFSSDGLEELEFPLVNEDTFARRSRMKDLRSNEKVVKGTPVFRLVRGQTWKLAVAVSEGEYSHLQRMIEEGKNTVRVLFHKDNLETTAEFICKKNQDKPYVLLKFKNYIQRYVDQRYLYVDLIISKTEGLKIPVSALVDKGTFRIPKRLLSEGGNSTQANVVNIQKKNKKGEYRIYPVTVEVYREDDTNPNEKYVYVASDDLKVGMTITDTKQSETYKLREEAKIPGVYNVNRGYTVFKPIDIVERNKDYCIISKENSEVALYDRLILNSSTVSEGQVIY